MDRAKKIQTMVTIPLDEFSELYKIKTNVESMLRYRERVKNGEPFEFMIDDIAIRMENYLHYYNNTYDRLDKAKKEGGKK